jgi:hypothetical protein
MKNARILLTMLAIVFAVAGSIAGNVNSKLSTTAYEYIPPSPGVLERCAQISTTCSTAPGSPCTVNSHKVGLVDEVSTTCGTQLNFN